MAYVAAQVEFGYGPEPSPSIPTEGAPQPTTNETPASGEVPESIPAGPSARPTAAQQRAINEMGNAYGCHTCGAKTPGTKSGNWVGDHQPSTALNTSGGPRSPLAEGSGIV
jgi:hypothetical protein